MAAGPAMIAAQAVMSIAGGLEQRGQYRAEARALDENARIEETQGAYDAVDALRAARMQQGEDITGAAASGVGLTGSIHDMLFAQAIENQYQAMSIRAEAGMRARNLRQQADGKRRAGDSALFQGVLRAGASAIQGMGAGSATDRVAAAESAARSAQLGQPGTIPIPSRATGDWGAPRYRSPW